MRNCFFPMVFVIISLAIMVLGIYIESKQLPIILFGFIYSSVGVFIYVDMHRSYIFILGENNL